MRYRADLYINGRLVREGLLYGNSREEIERRFEEYVRGLRARFRKFPRWSDAITSWYEVGGESYVGWIEEEEADAADAGLSAN